MGAFLTIVTFFLHILGGSVAMIAGLVALAAPKGGPLHRAAGDAFVAAMLVMGLFAAVLGIIRPGQIINVFIAMFSLYLVGTAWLTARRAAGTAGDAERAALAISLLLCVPFALVIVQIVTGIAVFGTAFRIRGPILVALSVFAAVMACAAIGDLRVAVNHGISGTARIARHLWRMCFGLTMALGSAFTNGFARLLPGPYHVPPAFFAPQLVMLVVLIYWLIRVRLPGWAGGRAARVPV